LSRAQPPLDPFARGAGKLSMSSFHQFVWIARALPQKPQLRTIAATPFANKQVHTKAETLNERHFVIKSLGLKTSGPFAIERKSLKQS
jgi:hypothetical protein